MTRHILTFVLAALILINVSGSATSPAALAHPSAAERLHIQSNVVASAARTASGNSGDLTSFQGADSRFLISVTAVSGTSPTMTIVVEGKTLAGNYVTLVSSTSITAVSSQSLDVIRLPGTYRISWTIGGTTPSFTFEIDSVQETQ